MKVFVDSSTNNPRPFAVDFDPSDSVQRLKSRIFEKGQIDPSDQALSFEAKPLKDAQTLQSYGIKPDARIQLNVKLRGGSESKESKPLLGSESSSIEQKKKKKKTYSGVSLQKAINQALDDSNLLPPDFKNIEDLKSTFSEKVEEKEKQVTRDGCWELGRHQDNAMSISISGDGRYVVTGGNDMAMKIFNFDMKTEVFCLENAHEDTVRKVVFTSDSKHIVSCSDDLAVKVFKFENEQAKEIFCLAHAHKERITALAVSHDCTYVISASKDRSINVLDFVRKESGQVELRLKHTFAQAHEGELKAVAISRDNKFFASASYDGTIKMFSIEEKAEVHAWTYLHSFGASCVTVSSDNKYILSGGGDGNVRVLDVETKQLVNSFIYEKRYLARNEISSVVLSNNNKYLIAADGDKSILVYDFQMNHLIHHIHKAHSGKIEQLALCADNHYIASCSTDFSVKAFELEVKNEVHYFQKAHSDTIISNNNNYIISCSGDGSIKVFDRLKKQELFAFERAHSNSIQTIAISHDDRYIVSGSSDQTIKIFDLESREEIAQIQATIGNILISSDDKYLISSDWKGIINVFDFKTRKLIHSFGDPQKERAIFALAISSNNRYIAAAAMKNIKLFDLVTLQSTYEFMAAHNKQIHSLRITRDGRYLISGSEDNSIKVFDMETKALVHHIENVHEEKLLTLDVSKDGKYIITGSKERSVKIFNAENKLMLCEINNVHEVALSKVVISNDKKFFVTASYEGDMKIHNFPFSDESWVFRRSSVIPPYLALGSYHNLLLKISNDALRTQNMLIYKDLLFLPYNWNILHLMAIFEPMNIPIIPSYSVLKMSTLVDTYKKTPLHYLLAQGNIDNTAANILFKYILDYAEDKKDNLQEYNEIFSSLTNLFPFIMSKINPSLRERFLSMSIHDITYPYNEKPIRFGKEESKSCFSKTSTLTPDIEQKIYQNGESQVSFSALKLNFDYHPLSDDMLNTAIALSANTNENIFQSKAVSHLIDHLWNTSWTFHCVVGILFSALMILMSVYIGLGDRSLGLEITMLVLCIFFLASEYFQVYNQRSNYLNNIWNWADLSYFKVFIATIIVRFCDADDDLSRGWLYSVLIIIGYVRWMSYFQLFGTTRKLIQFIRAVIWDMWGYIAILAFIIVGFALIFLEYDREQDYLTHLYATYNLLFGNSDDEGYDASQKIMLAIVLFFLCVVLLNLLISIMGASHGKVQDEEVVTEAHTKLDMILESTLLMRLVSINREEKRGYLMFCEPDYAEENDTEEAKLEGKIKVFRNMIKQNDQKINQMQESMKALEKKVSQNYRDILKAIAENKKRK